MREWVQFPYKNHPPFHNPIVFYIPFRGKVNLATHPYSQHPSFQEPPSPRGYTYLLGKEWVWRHSPLVTTSPLSRSYFGFLYPYMGRELLWRHPALVTNFPIFEDPLVCYVPSWIENEFWRNGPSVKISLLSRSPTYFFIFLLGESAFNDIHHQSQPHPFPGVPFFL